MLAMHDDFVATQDFELPLKRAYEDDEAQTATQKRTRGRNGCLNCRRRRKKCMSTLSGNLVPDGPSTKPKCYH